MLFLGTVSTIFSSTASLSENRKISLFGKTFETKMSSQNLLCDFK